MPQLPRRILTLGLLTALCACTGSETPRPTTASNTNSSGITTKKQKAPEPSAAAPPQKMVETAPEQAAAGSGTSTTAPYDLAVDQQRRARVAKEELGAKAVTAVVSDVFVVVGPPGWQGGQFESSVGLMRSSMAGYMNNRFSKKPSEAISVYLFPDGKSYEAFCTKKYSAPCIAHFGFYQPTDRYMVMNIGLGAGTLTHEIVHPLVESDFPQAPTWINEGIASVFEQPLLPKPGEIHGGKNWRHPRLKRALQSSTEKDLARLDRLFGMKDEVFRGDNEDLHYALARYVCQWLDEKGKLWPFYQKWRDNVATDPSGEKTFKEVVGMTPAEATPQFTKWTLNL